MINPDVDAYPRAIVSRCLDGRVSIWVLETVIIQFDCLQPITLLQGPAALPQRSQAFSSIKVLA